jgi:hypothetical protein
VLPDARQTHIQVGAYGLLNLTVMFDIKSKKVLSATHQKLLQVGNYDLGKLKAMFDTKK